MGDRKHRPWRELLFILLTTVAAGGLYLIGNNSVSLWDRDEPRYAQTSRQMLDSGDWIVPHLLDEPREKKPIFIYWCQATAMRFLGETAFAARLPSVIFVTLTLIVLASVLARTVGIHRAFWTIFIFATSALTIAAAKMSITDGVLILFVTVAQLCLYAFIYRRGSWAVTIACGLAVGFALLTKGPVVLGVMVTTVLVLAILHLVDRVTRKRAVTADVVSSVHVPAIPVAGAATLADLPAPQSAAAPGRSGFGWLTKLAVLVVLAVGIYCIWGIPIEMRAPGYTWRTIQSEIINRAADAQEGHSGPPGYYLLTIWATFFPWSLLLPAAIVYGWKNRRIPQIRFALAAVIGPWIMFEFVSTKLPHYLLPIFPALAFLTADMLIRAGRAARHWHRASEPDPTPTKVVPGTEKPFLAIVIAWGILITLLSLAPIAGVLIFGPAPWPAYVAMAILPLLSFEYGRRIYTRFRSARPLAAAATMGVGMLILTVVVYGVYLPTAKFLQISPQVAEVLKREGATHPGDAIMIDYKETSLPFYQGGTIRPERDNAYLKDVPPDEWPRWIVLTGDVWDSTPKQRRNDLYIIAEFRGLNYADGGRIENVLVVRNNAFTKSPLK